MVTQQGIELCFVVFFSQRFCGTCHVAHCISYDHVCSFDKESQPSSLCPKVSEDFRAPETSSAEPARRRITLFVLARLGLSAHFPSSRSNIGGPEEGALSLPLHRTDWFFFSKCQTLLRHRHVFSTDFHGG